MGAVAAMTDHPHRLDPDQAPLIDDKGRCLVCAVETFATDYDRQSALLSRLLHGIDEFGAEMTDTPDTRVDRALRIFAMYRGMAMAGGPYSLTQWTENVQHVDPCDCDEDDETVGGLCMANSEWTYAVTVDGGAFAPRLILTLPKHPPDQPDHDESPMVAVDRAPVRSDP